MSARASEVRTRSTQARRAELRVVQKRRSRNLVKKSESRRSVTVYVCAGLFAAVVVAAILLEQVLLAQSAFRLSDLREDLQAAEEKHEVLLLEAAQLDSSARIERYARENLGMVEPVAGGVQYIVADIKQPKYLNDRIGGKHATTIPSEGVATGDPYASESAP